MGDITTFKRYELKYKLTLDQKERLLKIMDDFMELDQYKRTTICNIYYDTEDFRLIRNSIEKPIYKEKLRVRSYGKARESSKVFVELKKKYDSVVYKRRITMGNQAAEMWLTSDENCPVDSQIAQEIEFFRHHYKGIRPQVFLSYEREAYYMKDGSDFRVTFDENIMARRDRLSLTEEAGGTSLLPDGYTLMELKISKGMPLWMADFLAKEKIYKTSYSKYGTYYTNVILPEMFGKAEACEKVIRFVPQPVKDRTEKAGARLKKAF